MAGLGSKIRDFFTRSALSTDFYEDLEDKLIEADLGPKLASELTQLLRKAKAKDLQTFTKIVDERISPLITAEKLTLTPDGLNVLLFLGVNGVGKTTTIAKVAHYFQQSGVKHISAAAGDTFRAAASEQLGIHGERLGFRVVKSHSGADSASVVHDALTAALAHQDRLLLVDTAGRMHNKSELLHELRKMDKIIRQRVPEENYRRILVIDVNTGQNCLRQAEVFHEAVGLSGVIASKYDGTAKGGVLVAMARDLQLPIYFLGTGERPDDLSVFDAKAFMRDVIAMDT
ncbi:signal recognition particle-docking protein FtsY [Entomospira culicis]|uniref:Signal recognition particle-docking protein FtsY n=1 Tax=Entomospira culicis TaxID=2719989 RepID=A0A968KWC6_9SPIO|nr:signal recognition particle-docking protein FtsY [Entomospira culicis]NIZ18837.1 signal recognition particle-docking protein FtsY [Entomospira culicis]NIZ69052.1 signal recognition particle-docking protein FtsY [Entomospira culicis]WDI37640.1 signal recognition particle-docking protein FtsY [Entomospira culicis]WDI39268.1 signal recognition particle-docking protein FtsY [Entomospira culicis]